MRNKDIVLSKLENIDITLKNMEYELKNSKSKNGVYNFYEQLVERFREVYEFINLEQQQ